MFISSSCRRTYRVQSLTAYLGGAYDSAMLFDLSAGFLITEIIEEVGELIA